MKKNVCQVAVKRFGKTDDIREAGYILPDGSMLDFSHGFKGRRVSEHQEINQVYGVEDGRYQDYSDKAITGFIMDCKAMRVGIGSEDSWTEMYHKPTEKQLMRLDEIRAKTKESMVLERTDERGREICSVDSDKQWTEDYIVDEFMKECFK